MRDRRWKPVFGEGLLKTRHLSVAQGDGWFGKYRGIFRFGLADLELLERDTAFDRRPLSRLAHEDLQTITAGFDRAIDTAQESALAGYMRTK